MFSSPPAAGADARARCRRRDDARIFHDGFISSIHAPAYANVVTLPIMS